MIYNLNEITLLPRLSDINSRGQINPLRDGKLPIWVAPMTSILNENNIGLFNNNFTAVFPRIKSLTERLYLATKYWVAVSLKEFVDTFCNNSYSQIRKDEKIYILIDVANGHMQYMYDMIKFAKDRYKNLHIACGNIASVDAYQEACRVGVSWIRAGIGGGECCITSVKLGIHNSHFNLIKEINNLKKSQEFINKIQSGEYKCITKVIADGGVSDISHIIKCLALGYDAVMCGGMFVRCKEACAQTRRKYIAFGPKQHLYYGMASKLGMKKISKNASNSPEGIIKWVDATTTLENITKELSDYLRSCMSYCGAHNLDEFIGKVHWEPMTECEFHSYYK